MTLIDAAKQALEALKAARRGHCDHAWADEAITALRAAIEAAEKQEPVAWAVFEGRNAHDLYLPQEYDEALKMAGYKGDHAEVKPLYTHPSAAPLQVSPTDFVDMVMDKEDAIGKPIFWAEWPNREKNGV